MVENSTDFFVCIIPKNYQVAPTTTLFSDGVVADEISLKFAIYVMSEIFKI